MALAFINFIIALVGLCVIVGMIFLALDRIARDAFLIQIGKIAVGGCAVIALLIDVRATFFGGGSVAGAIAPTAILEFAIGVIVLIAVFYLIDLAVTRWLPGWSSLLNYVLSVLMLILLLWLAEQALFGGGLGLVGSSSSQPASFHLQR